MVNRWFNEMWRARTHRSVPAQLLDMVLHKLRVNISPADYYRFEFFKKNRTWEEKGRYVGLNGSRYWPYENNHRKYNILFTNKLIQKATLLGLGLPTPRLIATVGRGFEVQSADQLVACASGCEWGVVVKPISGTGGKGVRVLESPDALRSVWSERARSQTPVIVEERVRNPPKIERFHPPSLNTYRVITIKTGDGRWHCAAAFLKVGCCGAPVDNAARGGIQVLVDEGGVTMSAYDFRKAQFIDHHPDTRQPLTGIRLPGFQCAVNTAMEASRRLGFMGTIGWDVAETTAGTRIIEGNSLWGVIDQRTLGGVISDEIARGLKRHGCLSRWDRSRMYPKCDRGR